MCPPADFFLQFSRQASQLLQLSVQEIRQAKEVVTKFPMLNTYHMEKVRSCFHCFFVTMDLKGCISLLFVCLFFLEQLVRMMMEFDKEINVQHMNLIVEFARIRKTKKKPESADNVLKFVDAVFSPKLVIPAVRLFLAFHNDSNNNSSRSKLLLSAP